MLVIAKIRNKIKPLQSIIISVSILLNALLYQLLITNCYINILFFLFLKFHYGNFNINSLGFKKKNKFI